VRKKLEKKKQLPPMMWHDMSDNVAVSRRQSTTTSCWL